MQIAASADNVKHAPNKSAIIELKQNMESGRVVPWGLRLNARSE
jgi:hypothetical protein